MSNNRIEVTLSAAAVRVFGLDSEQQQTEYDYYVLRRGQGFRLAGWRNGLTALAQDLGTVNDSEGRHIVIGRARHVRLAAAKAIWAALEGKKKARKEPAHKAGVFNPTNEPGSCLWCGKRRKDGALRYGAFCTLNDAYLFAIHAAKNGYRFRPVVKP